MLEVYLPEQGVRKTCPHDNETLEALLRREGLEPANVMVFHNGLRIYDFQETVKPSDYCLMIRASKQSRVSHAKKLPPASGICPCGKQGSFSQTVHDHEGNSRSFRCLDCFAHDFEQKAFRNIRIVNLAAYTHLDLGLSGERDSVVTLHLLDAYRERHAPSLAFVCTFNKVGIPGYDDHRQELAGKAFKRCSKVNDTFVVNSFNAFETSGIQGNSWDLCNKCFDAGRYRPYGQYKAPGVRLVGATGGGTWEDRVVNALSLPRQALDRYGNRHYLTAAESGGFVAPLDYMSEDDIALYAAAREFQYHAMPCPLAEHSNYHACRAEAVNNIKALFPEFRNFTEPVPGMSATGKRFAHPPVESAWQKSFTDYYRSWSMPVSPTEREQLASVFTFDEQDWSSLPDWQYLLMVEPELPGILGDRSFEKVTTLSTVKLLKDFRLVRLKARSQGPKRMPIEIPVQLLAPFINHAELLMRPVQTADQFETDEQRKILRVWDINGHPVVYLGCTCCIAATALRHGIRQPEHQAPALPDIALLLGLVNNCSENPFVLQVHELTPAGFMRNFVYYCERM